MDKEKEEDGGEERMGREPQREEEKREGRRRGRRKKGEGDGDDQGKGTDLVQTKAGRATVC